MSTDRARHPTTGRQLYRTFLAGGPLWVPSSFHTLQAANRYRNLNSRSLLSKFHKLHCLSCESVSISSKRTLVDNLADFFGCCPVGLRASLPTSLRISVPARRQHDGKMDATLLSFEPDQGMSDEVYDSALKNHIAQISRLFKDLGNEVVANAPQLLEVRWRLLLSSFDVC